MTQPAASFASAGAALELRQSAYQAGAGALPALLVAAQALAQTVQTGGHGRRRAGPGEEFWQYRPAQQGDEARFIDWRRSARADTQFVRDREWQLAQALQLWVDPGEGMRFSSDPALRPEKYTRACVLGLAAAVLAARAGERVGLSDARAPARSGRGAVLTMAALLAAGTPAERASITADVPFGLTNNGAAAPTRAQKSWQAAPDISAVTPSGRVLMISDFLADPAPIEAAIAQLAGANVRGVLLQVVDPVEEDFPFRGRTVFESVSGGILHETHEAEGLARRYQARLADRRAHLARVAAAAGWHFSTHRTDTPPGLALSWLYAALGEGG